MQTDVFALHLATHKLSGDLFGLQACLFLRIRLSDRIYYRARREYEPRDNRSPLWVRTTFGGYPQIIHLELFRTPPKWDAPSSLGAYHIWGIPTGEQTDSSL
jgi:hypothetical protein